MKKVLVLFITVMSLQVYGQNIDYNKIILPDNVRDAEFPEKLVQLAWKNHPSNEVFRREVNKAVLDKKRFTMDWLNIVNLQGNINQYVIDDIRGVEYTDKQQAAADRYAFYPKYNVRISINLGNFFTIPYDIKKSKQQIAITEANLNVQKLEIRANVLKAYNLFLMTEKAYKIQSQMLSDTESAHKLVEQKFKNGETTFENYVLSLNNFNRISIAILEAENAYKNSKLDLEQLIGLKVEEVR
ncbi:MAG TPA: TolC family protein [Cyclobacteriaceae bacterium]|nr:TolC family protein [Cyclobacteriaceae bacterium]